MNSTALAILLVEGELPQFAPFRFVWSDTMAEKDHTYRYINDVFVPWLEARGHRLERVAPKEGILERWERLSVTGSRLIRSCTVEGKIRPIEKHVAANGGGAQLIGIDAGESHRAKDKQGMFYPLVDLDIDREGCEEIIRAAGLPSPGKSGCWCCPFMRVGEVVALAKQEPCKFERIARLERAASELHGGERTQWGDRPVSYWLERAAQGDLFMPDREPDMPCECYAS